MDDEARQRIDDLEYRLFKYHEWLEESIVQRDRLALDAAWGVHYALYSVVAIAVLLYAIGRWISFENWLGGAVAGVGLFVIPIAVHMWSNGQRMKEVDRLAKLPDWDWKSG